MEATGVGGSPFSFTTNYSLLFGGVPVLTDVIQYFVTAQDIANIYKQRWQIELLFKKMKQNFQLHCFYGESENAICIQIWCTLIAQLLLTVLQRKTETQKAFSTIACLVRQHLLSYLNLEELLKNSKRFYEKYSKTVDYSNSLFPLTG